MSIQGIAKKLQVREGESTVGMRVPRYLAGLLESEGIHRQPARSGENQGEAPGESR